MWSRIATLVPLDKQAHFWAGGCIALVAVHFASLYVVGVLAAIFAGFVKEMIDENTGGSFDPFDFMATMAGGIVFSVIVWL